jgi:DNA-binding MarR family transcriptional regulator
MDKNTTVDLTRRLFQLIKQLSRLRQKPISTGDLTRSQCELLVLLTLHREEGQSALTVTEISNVLLITPAGVTHLVTSLEAMGYIKREQSPDDRRVVHIDLTGKGVRLAHLLMNDIEDQLAGLVENLGEDNSRILIRLLSRVNHYFASTIEEPVKR